MDISKAQSYINLWLKKLYSDENFIKKILAPYSSSSLILLLDRFDQSAFAPTFRANQHAVEIFHQHGQSSILISLTDLACDCTPTDISAILLQVNIADGNLLVAFTNRQRRSAEDLHFYYVTLLDKMPADDIVRLISKKRRTVDLKMLPDRVDRWKWLWSQKYIYDHSYHPLLFNLMTQFKGPIPHFLKQVHTHLVALISGKAIDRLVDEVNKTWTLTSRHTEFFNLWHEIMKENACTYFKTNCNNDERLTAITMQDSTTCYIWKGDKLLCFLLLLFNKPYRQKLYLKVLAIEEPPIFLSVIFTQCPQLK